VRFTVPQCVTFGQMLWVYVSRYILRF